MGVVQNIVKRIPSAKNIHALDKMATLDETPKKNKGWTHRFGFFGRRIRLRGNSKISVPLGIVLLFPCLVIATILFLVVQHPSNAGSMLIPTTGPPAIRRINEKHDKVFNVGCVDDIKVDAPRANAVFVVLARDKELEGVLQSLKSVERHFNRWFHYPYVFLNDGDFSESFKQTVQNYTSAPVKFGKIEASMWGYPDWVDHDVAREGIRKQGDAAIMYGGMESYHHMCRFYSGFFYKHELLQEYDWYWRVEPEISYFCDMTYDPFMEMIKHNKTYGFTIAVKELRETVPNIFRYASAYMRKNKLKSQGLWEMFLEPKPEKTKGEKEKKPEEVPEEVLATEPGQGQVPEADPDAMEGELYNMCHFWSNFEIARLDWFRSKEYEEFFQMMDRSGGFWMERWGDAPIHSLAAGALLKIKDVHYFRDFGYRHTTIQHCPGNAPTRQTPRQPYFEKNILDEKARREEDEYWADFDMEVENGVGCRCRCDTDIEDVEGKLGSCMPEWVDVAGGFL